MQDDQAGLGAEWARAARAEAAAGTTSFDLTVCLTEPIHLLGGIQSYGALLAVGDTGVVEVASANTTVVLGSAPESLIGTPVETLIGTEGVAAVRATLDAPTGDRGLCGLVLPGSGENFDVTVYRADGRTVLEFEPRPAGDTFRFSQFYPRLRTSLTKLQHERTVVDVCASAVAEIRRLTGYDRVVAYRFEGRSGPGEVIAESVADELEPWLGLWFPATDIPPQARRLYERNWIRVINDVDDATATLLPQVLPGTSAPLDLSDSALRTVSSFHLEYLRNIGVASSMSVSLLHSGELWGLIACHGVRPRRLDPEVRSACEFFGVTLSLQLAALEEAQTSRARHDTRTALARLVTDLNTDITQSVSTSVDLLHELIDADAVVLRLGGAATIVSGRDEDVLTPGLETLWTAAPDLAAGEVWSTDNLGEHDAAMAPHAEHLSGVLLLGLGGGDLIAWVRPERRASRTWATDPSTPVQLGERGQRLTPRGSSAVYRALTQGHCVPWTASDEAVAAEFGRAVSTLVLRHNARLTALNDELRRANSDLDTYAHVAAHELKEPLRGIFNSTAFIREDADDLDDTTVRRLDTVQRLAQRMDELINSLLHFAQLGHGSLRREEIDLRDAADAALEVAGLRLAERGVEVALPAPGLRVWADPDRLVEVLVNLLVNAAKYAREDHPRTVEITLAGEDEVCVRDNGIGIPAEQRTEVLRLFRRLHGRDAHGGGHGAGLAIVNRIVERHGGRVRLDATPGGGTSVLFTLPR
ncbi:ATP-binding protein [Lentzea sp. NPDC003310]|uniref:ATP-binding protein n=1 Tax=Lentzea sp. NPDC003310 TaxID=3154447 RepID=UPI0033A637E9